jgi:Glucose / Sorbosone dehydrogenase
MRALTGLGRFDWFLVTLYALALVLLWRSRGTREGGTRRFGVRIIPFASGLVAVLALVAIYPGTSRDALAGIVHHPWAVGFAAGTVLVAFALVDFVLENTVARPIRRLSPGLRSQAWVHDVFLIVNVGVAAVFAAVGLSKLAEPSTTPTLAGSGDVRVDATYAAGKVTDLVFTSPGKGYLALDDDTIARFDLSTKIDGKLALETVARVAHPRGLAIVGHTLFVSSLGRLPCDPKPCAGYDFPGLATEAGDTRYLKLTRGRVLAFDIADDGRLGDRREVVSNLPVANTLHAVNGIAAGPDGLLYLSIGNLDALYRHPGIATTLGVPRPDLLGTIVRFAPNGSRFEVIAKGLRNVYDLTFDRLGNLYGVDNDGPTLHGWLEEELLQIRKGANYGYPYDGTFGPYTVRTDAPLYTLGTAGSGGIQWAPNLGLEPGVVVGSCGEVIYVRLQRTRRGAVVEDPYSSVKVLLQVPGCVSTIEPGPNGTMALGVYPYAGVEAPSLYLVRVGA